MYNVGEVEAQVVVMGRRDHLLVLVVEVVLMPLQLLQ
jgi:hypothetical protein